MVEGSHAGFGPGAAIDELQAAQIEIAEAADAILFATETSLNRMAAFRAGEQNALLEVERALLAILGACAFQDLSGQRLSKVEDWLSGRTVGGADDLAHGPSLHGQGLDQAAADALFESLGDVANTAPHGSPKPAGAA